MAGLRARQHSGPRAAVTLRRSSTHLAAAAALLLAHVVAHVAPLVAQQRAAGPASPPAPTAAIRDSVAAVFRQPAYARSLKESTWNRALTWLGELFQRMFEAVHGSRVVYWTTVSLLTLLVVAVVARAAYLGYLRRDLGATGRGGRSGGPSHGGRDPWVLAQELAAAGNYTDAAHALYRALLEALARRERVRLHPSKTVGDYVRDLRQRSSSLFVRFRDFARSYETVVYGVGHCDRERYERLHALAAPIVQAGPEALRG